MGGEELDGRENRKTDRLWRVALPVRPRSVKLQHDTEVGKWPVIRIINMISLSKLQQPDLTLPPRWLFACEQPQLHCTVSANCDKTGTSACDNIAAGTWNYFGKGLTLAKEEEKLVVGQRLKPVNRFRICDSELWENVFSLFPLQGQKLNQCCVTNK